METRFSNVARTALFTVSMTIGAGTLVCTAGAAEPSTDNPGSDQRARFSLIDVNGDQKISKDEAGKASLPVVVRQWRLADKDGNNVLDAEEFSAFTKGASQPDASKRTFSEVDIDGDKKISRKEAENAGLTQLIQQWSKADRYGALSESEFSAFMQDPGSKPAESTSKKAFSDVDANGNGQVSREEARKAGLTQLVQQWNQADKDNDSVLGRSEFTSFMTSKDDKNNEPKEKKASSNSARQDDKQPPEGDGAAPLPPKRFSDVDADSDKNISRNEAQKAGMLLLVQQWSSADKDDDGVLNQSEFSAFMKEHGKAPLPQKSFSEVDSDSDKNVSHTEAKKAKLTQLVQQWDKADKDGDDVLSQSEFSDYMKVHGGKIAALPSKSFSEVDADKDSNVSKTEAQKAGMTLLVQLWNETDKDGDDVLAKGEFSDFMRQHGSNTGNAQSQKASESSTSSSDNSGNDKKPQKEPPKSSASSNSKALQQKFSKADANSDKQLSEVEASKAGMTQLLGQWEQADNNNNGTLSLSEFIAFMEKRETRANPQKSFSQADANGDKQVTKEEARKAGLTKLIQQWNKADNDGNDTLSQSESSQFMKKPGEKAGSAMVIGKGRFQSPETVLWDEQADVYLVSNINGKLTGQDDNGFISRVSPDGTILDLKWIDGAKPEVVLHGPKGMLFHDNFLVVADVGGVRFFERTTGKPVRSSVISDSHMLNGLAVGSDGKIYVSDTGSKVAEPPGAIYRLDEGKGAVTIAKGPDFDRPDGLIAHGGGLLVAPFAAHAKELYTLTLDGKRAPFTSLPQPKLDGLLRLPDDSLLVTSWKGKTVYRVKNGQTNAVAKDIPSPAQVGYDEKRGRLLVPSLRENRVLVYPLKVE